MALLSKYLSNWKELIFCELGIPIDTNIKQYFKVNLNLFINIIDNGEGTGM
jgi:hypothetical protein